MTGARWWLSPRWALAVIILASLVVLGWRLNTVPLAKWDEGIHASVSLETWQNHNWLSLTYHGEMYAAKPPLKFWLTTPLFYLFGPTEFAVRFWSMIAGIVTTWLLWTWGREATGRTLVGWLAAAMFLFGRFIFSHAFRTGETDGILVALWVFSLFAYWRAWTDSRWLRWSGIAVGLMLMTKPLVGVIPAAIMMIDFCVARGWKHWPRRLMIETVVWALAIPLPWHIYETFHYGSAFWRAYIGFNVIERTTEVLYNNRVSWHWYWDIIQARFFPFVAMLPLALVIGWRQIKWRERSLPRLLIIWTVVVFIIFSIAQTKFEWYILPIYPALILLIALMASAKELWPRRWFYFGLMTSLGYLIWLMPKQLVHLGWLWRLTPYAYLPEAWQTIATRSLVGLVAAVVIGLIVWRWRSRTWWLGLIMIYSLTLAGGWTISNLKRLPINSNEKIVSQKLTTITNPRVETVGLNLKSYPNLYFYLRRINGLELRENLASPSGQAWIISKTSYRDKLSPGQTEQVGDFILWSR